MGRLGNEERPLEIITTSAAETEDVGRRLALQLRPGEVVACRGDLGAGKTALTRGIARGLGIDDAVTSPTYTIVNEYRGRLPLFHFDLYRLSGPDDLFDIGWEDYLERGGVCVVEWSERAGDLLEDPIVVCVEHLGDDRRKITITGGKAHADLSL
jgi:tRNA threonylcarbamoyladenosine biosynthesis protein TsaE